VGSGARPDCRGSLRGFRIMLTRRSSGSHWHEASHYPIALGTTSTGRTEEQPCIKARRSSPMGRMTARDTLR